MHNIIFFEKYLPSSYFWPNLLRKKKITGLSVEEIIIKYQGFEGELIDIIKINGSEKYIKNRVEKLSKLFCDREYYLLHIFSDSESSSLLVNEYASFVGFDVGVCEKEKTIYSSIFNEILFGNIEELISFQNLLNENFLFEQNKSAEEYIKKHNELSALGKDVEDYEQMKIYEIWKHNPSTA